MSAEQLSLVVSRLVKRCGTRDPLQIAADIGIEVMMCDNFGPLKGMYRVIKRNRFIFINEDLPFWLQRIGIPLSMSKGCQRIIIDCSHWGTILFLDLS